VKIKIISAFDANGVIGVNGKLPWHIPEDLRRFKSLTTGHAVIMGRKTWESLPFKPLPARQNIIVSTKTELLDDVWLCGNLTGALYTANEFLNYEQAFIIGGSRLYEEAIPLADTLLLTIVDQNTPVEDGDEVAYFPLETWNKERVNFELEQVEYREGYRFERWERKK
jgi:dihydrofolate reductase